jgi:Uma2 family endonuclease
MEAQRVQINTIDDINALPEDKRAELIDGQIYYQAAPGKEHQFILGELFWRITNHIKENNGKCRAVVSPFAVYLNGDESEYFEPDITVICDPNKLDNKKGCFGAPDWIIEITSPSTASRDYILKLNKYQEAGVREYWIVDPDKQSIFAYHLGDQRFEASAYTFKDRVKVNIFEGLVIDFQEV